MKKFAHFGPSRGSALAATLIFTMVSALLAFAVLRWSATERRLNMRGALWLAARNAAEGVAEYGFSQVRNDFETIAGPATNYYQPGSATALNLPNASVFAGTNVVTGALSSSNPNGMELIAGKVTQIPNNNSGSPYWVDPNDYNNQFDPLKGKWVFRRDVVVLARATVQPPSGAPITHYMTETVSVRGAPLFAYAIFYNSDLELSPGPQMDITGPVHCNGNIWAAGENSGGLNFHGPVTCAGYIFHAWMNSNTAAQGSGEGLGQTPTTFVNSAGVQVNMKATSNNTSWKDSTMGASYGVSGGTPAIPATGTTAAVPATGVFALITPAVTTSFLQYAAATWGGNLQTSANGVLPYNPISFNQVLDAAGTHPNPTVMIDPPSPPATSDPYYTGKAAVESEKKSMQAGLYIKVAVPASGSPTISLYGPANSAPAGTPAANIGPNGGLLLNPPTNVNNAPSSATPPLVTYLPFRRLKTVVTSSTSGSGRGSTTTYTSAYTVLKPDGTTDSSRTVANTTASSGSTGTSYSIYTDSSTGSYGYGLYDQRRGLASASTTTATPNAAGQIDLVQIDMAALRALVNSMSSNTADANAITYTDPATGTTKVWNNANAVASGIIPAAQTPGAELQPWNGAIYIDVSAPNSGTGNQTTSVRLVNGAVANGSSLIPSYGPNGTGLSVATNAPLYILGNFNADGTITSASSNTPDDGGLGTSASPTKESPVALASDAITLLSPTWSDANSLNLAPSTSANMEVAAAFLTGYVGTTSTGFSGGAHNLPRFLEHWNTNSPTNTTGVVAIRGSMVAMFNSRIASQPWLQAAYSAPTRQWGFDYIFNNGNFPPYSPKVMSYRRVDFTDLTAEKYASMKASMWP